MNAQHRFCAALAFEIVLIPLFLISHRKEAELKFFKTPILIIALLSCRHLSHSLKIRFQFPISFS
jgi:hypothetical protein